MSDEVLVFDGDCGFCTVSVMWLFRNVRPIGVEAIRGQSFDLAAHGLTMERARYEVLWVTERGEVVGGARAIARLLRASERSCWRLVGQALSTPPVSVVAGLVYRVIARNRQRMPGGTDACAVRITRDS
ncbi:thiol-disulfide oxidoreductase DCC family protein [Kutzneria buriramensis]|uniref:Putative DCC family thiol-disulfide oxidoreductase YuxK n=1 Tax=Kutzneria buriramensis TaxID=1045776 RepID=A0A3E0GTG2_9PSEU|nr:DCC1-like thiol-disulfide oxidoreductase family protein [Kutzneria buriramensis]REH27013.1 putative DCC family thiol-disulfide oxidoreductase YuxK [Kutzneria buriramensis]